MEAKANISLPDSRTYTPLHYAIINKNLENVCYLVKHGASLDSGDYMPLYLAAETNQIEMAELFLKQNKDIVNAISKNGVTALHVSAFNGHLEMVKLLIKNGINVNAREKSG